MIAARITRNAAKARRRPRGSDFSECRFGNGRDKLLQPLVTTKLAALSIRLSTWRSIKSGIIEPCRPTPGSGAGAWRIRLLSIAEVVCDPAPSMGGHEPCSSPGLSTPASRRTTPLQRLIERDLGCRRGGVAQDRQRERRPTLRLGLKLNLRRSNGHVY